MKKQILSLGLVALGFSGLALSPSAHAGSGDSKPTEVFAQFMDSDGLQVELLNRGEADAYRYRRGFECVAEGHVRGRRHRRTVSFYGWGQNRHRARRHAMRKCNRNARGCYIDYCSRYGRR